MPMPRDNLQIGGEGVGPSPRIKPAPRKATSPYTPANRNPLTGEIMRVPGYDDDEDEVTNKQPPAITPSKPIKPAADSNGVASALGVGGSRNSHANGHEQNHTASNKNNPSITTTSPNSSEHGSHVPVDFNKINISDNGSVRHEEQHQQQSNAGGKGYDTGTAAAQQLYDKHVRQGESDNALHHRIRLDDQFTNALKSILPERIGELCHNQLDTTMITYNSDNTCAKLPFIARVVTTRLPHVCDDFVGCLFVRGGRVPHSGGGRQTNGSELKSASKPPQHAAAGQQSVPGSGLALFFYKPLTGKRPPLLQPFVSCAPLRHATGWKKGSTIGLSDIYVGAEISVEPREVLKQLKEAVHGKKKSQIYQQDDDEQQNKGQITLSALANELLEADRYMILKVMWLDDSVKQQCVSNIGKPLAIDWAGEEANGVERIRNIFGVREKISQKLREIPSWKSVCFDIFGRLVSHCLAAVQNTEINTRDEGEGRDTSPMPANAGVAAMSTMTKQQVLDTFAASSDIGQLLALDAADVDTIFEHLLPQRASAAGDDAASVINTLHLSDFIAFSWTSEHETWLLRKAYRKLDPSCTGVVSYKTLQSFTCARNATLTTGKGVREISSFVGLGGEVKEMFDDFIDCLKKRTPNGITYYDMACFINTLAVNDGWKQPENDMDRANLIAWSIKRLFTIDD